jgi:hypothetical protein
MFGGRKHKEHPKKDTILKSIRDRVTFPKKIQNLDILRKKQCLIAPRFAGRSVYLWVKGKTRVWIDRKNVYLVNTNLPVYSKDGILANAELYKNDEDKWVIAFEDLMIYKGDVLDTPDVSFTKRQMVLREFVGDLQRGSDPVNDPGVFCVKPWYTPKIFQDKIRKNEWKKKPEWAIVWAQTPGSSKSHTQGMWFCRIQDTSFKNVYRIVRSSDTNPDQYDLLDTGGKIVSRACVRSMRVSKWLKGLEDGTHVRCKNIQGIKNPEPYEIVNV